jgi:hypothetical protein
MKKYICLTLFICFCQFLMAQDWSTNVAPIIYNKCANCHHSGGAGHANFTSYDTVKAFAGSINAYISTGKMPPWPPDPTYKNYAHERRLSTTEISTITSWITNNIPLGDTNLAPPKPVYSGAAILTQTPTGTIKMPNYTITQSGTNTGDIYMNFAISIGNSSSISIKGFEFLPGNPAFVHHALIYVDTGNTCLNLDAAFAGPGYEGFGGTGSNTSKLIGAFVPGSTPFLFPQDFGIIIPANATIIFSLHYPAAAVGQMDSSKINYFAGTVTRPVLFSPVLNHFTNMVNGPLFIPAYTTKTFIEKYTVPQDVSVFGIAPHMHLIGKSIKVYGVKTNSDTIPLINIPKWDFKWQGMYYFKKIEKIPANATLWSSAFYDNTTSNLDNPNNPPQLITAGENTDDEMMLTYFAYTSYLPGDENISLEPAIAASINPKPTYNKIEFFVPYPNPSTNNLYLKWYTRNTENIVFVIRNLNGVEIQKINVNNCQGYKIENINISSLANGLYTVELQINGIMQGTQKFIKN